MITELKLQQNETSEEFRLRIYKLKYQGIVDVTWAKVAMLFNRELGLDRGGDTWRKESKKFENTGIFDAEETESESEDPEATLRDLITEYRKERYKLSDVSIQNNAAVRRMAREETIKEIAFDYASKMSSKKLLAEPPKRLKPELTDNVAVLQLSDWHYGIDVDTYWNKFNPDICKSRVSHLRDEVLTFCSLFHITELNVVNLGDLICGRIHQTLRLQSRIDVITQTMDVAEILAEFISDITAVGIKINYYDCLDNHSRLEPVKMDSLDLESLVRIIPWYLNSRLKKNDLFEICENEYDEDIITFNIRGYRIGGVHGHKDKPGKVVQGLTLMTKNSYDMILTSHLHHFNSDEQNEVMVVSNGSLMGTDYYAKDLRLSAKASQNIILVNEKSVADYIHRIVLN